MTTKSIIEIQVDDSQFKAFNSLFQQYQEQVEKMPDSWKQAMGIVNKSKKSLGEQLGYVKKTADQAAVLTDEIEKATKAQKDFGVATLSAGTNMKKMAESAKSLNSSMFSMGKFLLKLDALGVLTGALGTIGGLFGFDYLGNSAVQTQRSARGLGLNPGQLKAFNLDFSRYVDPSVLNTIASAQSDFTGRVWLARAAGISYSKAGSEDVAQLAAQTAIRAHNWWVNTPQAIRTQQALQATGLGQIYSMEDIRRLGNTPLSELLMANRQYSQDSRSLNFSNSATSAWYQLTRQFSLAGHLIETNLIRKLQALGPSLGATSMSFAKDINALVNGITPQQIQDFANGVKSFAEYLGSPQTLKNLKDFVQAMGDVAHFVLDIAKLFGGGGSSSPRSPVKPTSIGLDYAAYKWLENKFNSQNSISVSGRIRSQLTSYLNHPGNLNISNSAGNWISNAPSIHANGTLNRNNQIPKVNITVSNKTGSDIFTSANAAVGG